MISKKNFMNYVIFLSKILPYPLDKKCKDFIVHYHKDRFFREQLKNYIFKDDMELKTVPKPLLYFITNINEYITDIK